MPIRYIVISGSRPYASNIVAKELSRELRQGQSESSVINDSFQSPIKHFVASALGEKYAVADLDRMRSEFNGMNIRAFVSALTTMMDAEFGDDVLVRWLIHRSLRSPANPPRYYIVNDGDEVEPDHIQTIPNVYLVNVESDGKLPWIVTDPTGWAKFDVGAPIINGAQLWGTVQHLARAIEAYYEKA